MNKGIIPILLKCKKNHLEYSKKSVVFTLIKRLCSHNAKKQLRRSDFALCVSLMTGLIDVTAIL